MPHLLHIPTPVYVLASLAGAAGVITWRFRETSSPVTVRKLIIPPLGMSTGFFMFVVPETRVPLTWAVIALALGALVFAYPLARSSTLTRSGGEILMQRSKAFLLILLGLVAVRFALRAWIEQYLTQLQTGALFFLLAFGAIARWRVGLLRQFLKLRGEVTPAEAQLRT
jgi:membrane protein CcdC involved in cytochrome C biogenesis